MTQDITLDIDFSHKCEHGFITNEIRKPSLDGFLNSYLQNVSETEICLLI